MNKMCDSTRGQGARARRTGCKGGKWKGGQSRSRVSHSTKTETLLLIGNHHVESLSTSSPNHGFHALRNTFADIKFHSAAVLELRKKTFPDRSNSAAYHTHTLLVACPKGSRSQMRNLAVGFDNFLVLCG